MGRNIGGENALTTLSQRTGGRVFEPSLGAALDQAFDQILRDLRTQYLIAFYPRDVPPTKERFHSLEISLAKSGLQVKARNGYYGEAQQNAPVAPSRVDASPGSDSIRTPRKPPQPDKRRSSQN